MALVEGVDEREDLGYGPVKLDRYLRVEVEAGEDLDEGGVLADRDVVFLRDADYFFGDCAGTLGRNNGGGMFLRIVLDGRGDFRFFIHILNESNKKIIDVYSRKQAQRFADPEPFIQADLIFPADIAVRDAAQC